MMMMGPRLGHALDLVEDPTQLGFVRGGNSLVSVQARRVAVTASWIAAGRTSSRLATYRADLSKSLLGRHGGHVAALVSVDAVPELGTPRGFAIGFELGVVKTGKQFARESSPNVDRKPQGLVNDSLCVHRVDGTTAYANGQSGTLRREPADFRTVVAVSRRRSEDPTHATPPGSAFLGGTRSPTARPEVTAQLRGPSAAGI